MDPQLLMLIQQLRQSSPEERAALQAQNDMGAVQHNVALGQTPESLQALSALGSADARLGDMDSEIQGLHTHMAQGHSTAGGAIGGGIGDIINNYRAGGLEKQRGQLHDQSDAAHLQQQKMFLDALKAYGQPPQAPASAGAGPGSGGMSPNPMTGQNGY